MTDFANALAGVDFMTGSAVALAAPGFDFMALPGAPAGGFAGGALATGTDGSASSTAVFSSAFAA